MEPKRCKVKTGVTEKKLIDNGFTSRTDYCFYKKSLYKDRIYGDMIFVSLMVDKEDNWIVVQVFDKNANTYAPFYNPSLRHDNEVADKVIKNYNKIIDEFVKKGIMELEGTNIKKTSGKKIRIKYHSDIEKLGKIDGNKSDWIDLRVAEDAFVPENGFKLVPLGVSMELPKGYEAHIVPRSSTFKNFGIIQTNHQGVIDESYRGDNDQWMFPAYCIVGKDTVNGRKGTMLKKNERICQFRIMKKQPEIIFEEVDKLEGMDRGGFGSTGRK